MNSLKYLLVFFVAWLAILCIAIASGFAQSRNPNPRDQIKRAESMMRLALQAWKSGEVAQAADYYQNARKLAPHDARTSFALAHFRFAQGQYTTASGLIREGMEHYPEWARLNFDLSLLFPHPQEFVSQREALIKFVNGNPDNANVEDARFLLAYVYYFSGSKKDSFALIRKNTWVTTPREELAKIEEIILAREREETRLMLAGARPLHLPKPFIPATLFKSHSSRAAMLQWFPTISAISKRHRLNPKLVAAVIHVESRFNPWAISPRGARGMMQLIPATADRFGVRNIHDPQQNIEGGVRYLRFLLDTFGDPALALAGYNAGENNVMRYGGIPPFRETQQYVQEVLAVYRGL